MNVIKKMWRSLWPTKDNQRRLPGESGQTLIILAFAFLGLIALLGLALDLGLVYVERIRIKRTVDAASLAAVAELPNEEEAIQRALQYLTQNGYNVPDSNIYVAGCIRDLRGMYKADGTFEASPPAGSTDDLVNLPSIGDLNTYAPTVNDTLPYSWTLFYPYSTLQAVNVAPNDEEDTSFYIDTRTFQSREDPLCDTGKLIAVDAEAFGSATRIRVSGQVPVRMNFMQFFGFSEVIVADSAVAENSSSLDAVVVLDTTGSMSYDTICYGCWERCDQSGVSCGTDTKYTEYPNNGRRYPIDYYAPAMQNLICGEASCDPGQTIPPKPASGTNHIIIEAELYTSNNSVWDPAFRTADRGYWAMQRYSGANASAVDSRGAYVRHHPIFQEADTQVPFGHRYTLAEITGGTKQVPKLEYNFTPTWSGNTYIHLKTQYFSSGTNDEPDNEFFWGIQRGGTVVAPPQSKTGGSSTSAQQGSNSWSWITIGPIALTSNSLHRLNIWAGSPGYAIDKIIITDQSSANSPINMTGLSATAGSAQGIASDPCNVIFGLNVLPTACTYTTLYGPVNNLNDTLFGDLQPMRGAQESIRAFVARLDPKLDQAGFVNFAASATQRVQLECLLSSRARKSAGTQLTTYPGMPGVDHDELNCNDPDLGTTPISYTLVFKGIEDAWPPANQTDIADGLRRGLHMLGVTTDNDGAQTSGCDWTKVSGNWRIDGQTQPNNVSDHCDRGQAATPIIVLMTDGAPTDTSPGDNADCKADHSPKPYETYGLKPALYEDTYSSGELDRYDCIIYYTDIAADNGILIYTIGLGAGADPDLLNYVAEATNGQYYFAPSAAQLNIIFDQILANVYIRLLQ